MRRFLLRRFVLSTTVAVFAHGCGTSPESPVRPASPDRPELGVRATLTGAGDIASCGNIAGAEATAKLLDSLSGTIFTAGDNAQIKGEAYEYERCFGPTWGRHLSRIRPAQGGHDYLTPAGAPSREYFKSVLPSSGLTYYGYDLGGWRILVLDDNIAFSSGSNQDTWLRSELEEHRGKCMLAIFHEPLFSSGPYAAAKSRPLWAVLYEFGVDVIVNGHDHMYERFAPQDPLGRPDAARGIRQFTVGTGGAGTFQFVSSAANSEVRNNSTLGVIRFTLQPDRYDWAFIPVRGGVFRDSGTATCSPGDK